MSLRVLSYNVRYATLDTGEDDWVARREGVASVVRFHDPDLVCLQEVWQRQLADLRERLPGYEWAATGTGNGEHTPIGYRPDRFSLVDQSAFSLSETPEDLTAIGWDGSIPRITTEATFTDDETADQFAVLNTHFDHVGEHARERSAELLAGRVADHSVPVLVTGDFNSTPDDPPYEILTDETGPGLSDARVLADDPHGPETTFNDFDEPQPGRRIDHVLVSEGVSLDRFGVLADLDARGRYPSDHFALLAECTFP